MSQSSDRLYQLLPSFYRLRDAGQGEPLRALLGVLEEERAGVESDIAGLYANLTSFAVAVGSALAGLSYMSLAWASLAGLLVTVAVSLWFRPAHLPRWDRAHNCPEKGYWTHQPALDGFLGHPWRSVWRKAVSHPSPPA